MQCPKCQFENPDTVKFCGHCGTRLEIICPSGQSSNPRDFQFCGNCGYNLTQPFAAPPQKPTFDEKIAKIQRYLPQGLAEKILSQPQRIETTGCSRCARPNSAIII